MADLGAHGTGPPTVDRAIGTTGPTFIRSIVVDGQPHYRITKDTVEGNVTPSARIAGPGVIRFRVPVSAGARTLSIDVKFSPNVAPYPSMRVPLNPLVGLTADQTATASAGTGYQTLSVSWTATAPGGVWVELWANAVRPDAVTNFDNFLYQ